MVEHDLAKVGVASSNLVSRSILLIMFFLSTVLFSKTTFILKSKYCIKKNKLFIKDIFPKSTQNIELLDIPKGLVNYKVPSLDILTPSRKIIKNPIIDMSGGIVTFDMQCYIKYDKKSIINSLKNKFLQKYHNLKIENIIILPISSFPSKFQNFRFVTIKISDYNLRKNEGSFAVLYRNNQNRILRVYFKFKIMAKITLLKAKNNITNGKILNLNDYKKVEENFTKIPMGLLRKNYLKNYIAKTFIRKGEVLTTFLVQKRKMIIKKESVTAIIKNGGLVLEFFATALNSGNKGDIINIVNNNGKIFKAEVIQKGLVEVQ